MNSLSLIIMLLSVILSIAFITLIERKLMSLAQNRLGPNKITMKGILQPLFDGVKLILKENIKPTITQPSLFKVGPTITLMISLLLWFTIQQTHPINQASTLLLFLLLIGLMVYSLLLSGWMSWSKYATMGALRSVAQSVSYEISLGLVTLAIIYLAMSLTLTKMNPLLIFFPMMLTWIITCLGELNRTPFDFSEGESELISGFNIEYSSTTFTLIFLGEYGMIILFSVLTTQILMNQTLIFLPLFIMLLLLVRSSYPRHRYDLFMSMSWLMVLPLSMTMFSWMMSMS